jgi:NTP pyrophosphatase (non-canonical NTP hydrolase)
MLSNGFQLRLRWTPSRPRHKPVDLQQLTQAMHDFVRSQGWYEADSLRPQTLRNLAISLSLESNEVLEHFQWDERLDDPQAFADELADVALYLLQIASLAGIDLEQAVLNKLQKNYTRTWDEARQPNEPGE